MNQETERKKKKKIQNQPILSLHIGLSPFIVSLLLFAQIRAKVAL